jgi:dimethylglycine dehydrogenase
VLGVANGWGRPLWFAPDGVARAGRPSFRRGRGFDAVGAEVRAVCERVGLADLTSAAKLVVSGPGAAALLDRLTATRLPPPGRVARALCLTPRGSVACDVTVARLGPTRFYLVSVAAAELHDLDWLRRHAPADGSVAVENVTSRDGILLLAGRRAPDVLADLTRVDVSEAGFPAGTVREITVGAAPVRALRVDGVGERAWALLHRIEEQVGLYDALMAAGRGLGIANVGLHALDSIRLEQGERVWGTDLTTAVTPLDAGLEGLVAFDKGEFVGRAALLDQLRAGARTRLVTLEVTAADADCWGNEAVHAGDRVVGITTSGGYGHRLGKSLAVACLDAGVAGPGQRLEVEILGDRRPAVVRAEPSGDPRDTCGGE